MQCPELRMLPPHALMHFHRGRNDPAMPCLDGKFLDVLCVAPEPFSHSFCCVMRDEEFRREIRFKHSAPAFQFARQPVRQSHLSGKWTTDVMTGGTLSLNKLASTADLPIELVFVPKEKQGERKIRKTTIYDTRNKFIDPFCLDVGSLKELNNIFIDAAKSANEIEEKSLKERLPIQRQRAEIENIPDPFIAIHGEASEFISVSDPTNLDISVIPPNLRSINFSSYQESGLVPSNGVQINIININGTDIKNAQSSIYVYGSDKRWVEATFGSVRNFFEKRKTKRSWLHKRNTDQLALFLLIIPITFWAVFRIDSVIPTSIKDVKILGDTRIFGTAVFLYALAMSYFGRRRLLRYFRLTFPLYEIRFPTPHWRQKHRAVAWVTFLGIVGSILADIIVYLAKKS